MSAKLVGIGADHVDILGTAKHDIVEHSERELGELKRVARDLLDPRPLSLGDRLADTSRQSADRMDGLATYHRDDFLRLAALPEDQLAGVETDLGNHSQDVSLRLWRVGTDYEVGPAERVEVCGVVAGEEGRVQQLAELAPGGRRLDPEDGVERLGRGDVMRFRADSTDARSDPRKLLDWSALAELLEAAQFGHLEERVRHLALLVQEELNPTVSLEPGDRVDPDGSERGTILCGSHQASSCVRVRKSWLAAKPNR